MKLSILYVDCHAAGADLNYFLYYFLTTYLVERVPQAAYSFLIVKI